MNQLKSYYPMPEGWDGENCLGIVDNKRNQEATYQLMVPARIIPQEILLIC